MTNSNDHSKIPLMTRVNAGDRDALIELARRFDRSLSREIGRAVHFYVTHFEEVDRSMQARVERDPSRIPDRR